MYPTIYIQTDMQKHYLFIIASFIFALFVACGPSAKQHSFDGVFFTESGIRFELKPDSTTLILFQDSTTYEGTWTISHTADNQEYANIEFGGYPKYYYLKDSKLYYEEEDMLSDQFSTPVVYAD